MDRDDGNGDRIAGFSNFVLPSAASQHALQRVGQGHAENKTTPRSSKRYLEIEYLLAGSVGKEVALSAAFLF